MYERPELRRLITNATLLVNDAVTIDGVRLWGSPVTCDDEAFGCSSAEERRALYESIPEGTDKGAPLHNIHPFECSFESDTRAPLWIFVRRSVNTDSLYDDGQG
jgi:hypothetical protein